MKSSKWIDITTWRCSVKTCKSLKNLFLVFFDELFNVESRHVLFNILNDRSWAHHCLIHRSSLKGLLGLPDLRRLADRAEFYLASIIRAISF